MAGELERLIESPSVEQIKRYQKALGALPQIDVPVEHHFAEGLYGRPMFMQAGESVVGAVHKKEHLCIVVGHCIVVDGKDRKELSGWNVFTTKPGAKRAIVALKDTIWMTVHATDLTDVDAIEHALVETEPGERIGYQGEGAS